jgi:ATP-dependent DNA helicase RecG
MPEQQNIEYKQSWHDDYLKWVCGFANAQGGLIFIGKDDNGNIVHVPDYKKLMDEIPNKIRNVMGITVEVNLQHENEKYFIEIITHPYSVPISLRGRYYYRSGSTKQELTGASLNEFLLKKSGKTWDDVIEPRATLADIDEQTIKLYLKAAEKAGRLPEFDNLNTSELLDKLRLTENNQLKRAAIVLFGKDPGKFYPNMFVKIGRFGSSDADLRFQEQEEGNIINVLDSVLNQLKHKFLISNITFEGMNRIEKPEYPVAALREILLNALIHRTYMGAHTQIRVYDNKIDVWNDGFLPIGITLEALKQKHSSKPRNPIIADVCFKGGYIDSWGRGTIKIMEACKNDNLPEPEFLELSGGFLAELSKSSSVTATPDLIITANADKVLSLIKQKTNITAIDIAQSIGISDRAVEKIIDSLKTAGIIERKGSRKSGYWKVKSSE